jgi:hypothetical protein
VMFTGGSGPAVLVDSRPAAVVARSGREASAARAAGRPRPRDLERAAVRRAWQGGRAPCLARRAVERYALEAVAHNAWQGQRPCARRQQASR